MKQSYLALSKRKLEWRTSISWAVNLLAIGKGQNVMTLNFLSGSWEVGSISWLEGLDVNAHVDC